jgi:hypothetical protein
MFLEKSDEWGTRQQTERLKQDDVMPPQHTLKLKLMH